MKSVILGKINTLGLSHFENDFMNCSRIILGEIFSQERLNYC